MNQSWMKEIDVLTRCDDHGHERGAMERAAYILDIEPVGDGRAVRRGYRNYQNEAVLSYLTVEKLINTRMAIRFSRIVQATKSS